MTGAFATAFAHRTAKAADSERHEAPMARPLDPGERDAPLVFVSPDVTAPKGAALAGEKVAALRAEERRLKVELRHLGSAEGATSATLAEGAQLEAQLVQTTAAADTAERALAASWVAAYDKAREQHTPEAREAYERAVVARESFEAARLAAEAAEGLSYHWADRLQRLSAETAHYRRRLDALTRQEPTRG
jgi:hypothetical protein